MSSNDFARFSRFSVENILTFNKSRSRFRGQKSNARTLNKKVGFDSPGKRRFVFSHNLFNLCFVLCEELSRVITSAATRNCSLTSCSESVLSLRQSCKPGSDFNVLGRCPVRTQMFSQRRTLVSSYCWSNRVDWIFCRRWLTVNCLEIFATPRIPLSWACACRDFLGKNGFLA